MSSSVDHHNWFKAKKLLRERVAFAAERIAYATEREARVAEKADRAGKTATRIQWIAVLVAVLVVLATAWAALEARDAIRASQSIASQQAKDSKNIASQQSAENNFTIAVTAIGSKDPLQQVAGFMILHNSVRSEINAAIGDPSWRSDAYDAYVTSIDVLSIYLHDSTTLGQAPPLAALSAGNTLGAILQMGPMVQRFAMGPPPSIDLSKIALPGADLRGARIDQFIGAYMPGIDLRGASLEGSFWGTADLEGAHLQCADLRGANLGHANLRRADLRGADLSGALLPSTAALRGAKTDRAVGPAPGLRIVHPATSYQPGACRAATFYADLSQASS